MTIILAGSGLFAQVYTRSRNLILTIVLAAVLGAVFNFFDFLINPPMMPMLLAFIVANVELGNPTTPARPDATAPVVTMAGLTALSWFGGYALTWAADWSLAIYLAPDAASAKVSLIKQILLRLYGVEIDSVVPMYPLVPTLSMIIQSFISAGSVFVALFAAALLVHARKHWAAFDKRRFLLLSSPTLIAMLWFEVLNNHTQTHSHFTYRSESAAIAIVFAAFLISIPVPATLQSLLRNLWLRSGRSVRRPSI
jgi:hypothetical protein